MRSVSLTLLLAALGTWSLPARDGTPAWDKRIPGPDSKVVGFPDPAPPYRMKRIHAGVRMEYPVMAKRRPGTDEIWIITQATRYGPTKIGRFREGSEAKELEPLLEKHGVAYDIAFHPRFKENGFVYIGHSVSVPEKGNHTRVTRFTVTDKPDPASAKIIIEWPSDGHNGGAICFGKDDMMFVTSGDGTSDSDKHEKGQDTASLLAKVLRIDVDHPAEGKTYAVPMDNPFVGKEGFAPETWAMGLRNPWRIACDEKTGHIWVGNNGQDLWEQVYFVRKGDNYGWSLMEGGHPFYTHRKTGPQPFAKPTFDHSHAEARSLTGGFVYYGKRFPELQGSYIYGDYSTGRIWAARHDGEKVLWHKLLAVTTLAITGFTADKDGEILICDHQAPGQGGLYTLQPTPAEDSHLRFPRKLSESGLFDSVPKHEMKPGVVPYSVIAPFWSDGMYKQRWLHLPGDSKIEYKKANGWEFPDETVVVKSFAVEQVEGDSKSRKWVETRFLTRQRGQWYGYSYVWNDEGTDATLVGAEGMDKEFRVKTAMGEQVQKWRYPSRADCMVCHSRAANYTLGLSELQMDKQHDYGGFKENQISLLDRLGYFTDKPEPAEKRKRLVDPYDDAKDLDARARSWLHVNCANCHVEAGGGNAKFDASFGAAQDKVKLFDVPPTHHAFDIKDATLIAPGDPARSVLLHRIRQRKEGFMPPLATNEVDAKGVELLTEWIRKMK